jgi:hypothetical protein
MFVRLSSCERVGRVGTVNGRSQRESTGGNNDDRNQSRAAKRRPRAAAGTLVARAAPV